MYTDIPCAALFGPDTFAVSCSKKIVSCNKKIVLCQKTSASFSGGNLLYYSRERIAFSAYTQFFTERRRLL